MTTPNRGGRPRRPGGPDRTRSLRIGPVWDQAKARAERKGTTITAVVNQALTAYVREDIMLATVATAGTITDQHRISVDQTRDGLVVATPFTRDLTAEDVKSGEDLWDVVLVDAGWTVTTGWDDHDGYWTAEVEQAPTTREDPR